MASMYSKASVQFRCFQTVSHMHGYSNSLDGRTFPPSKQLNLAYETSTSMQEEEEMKVEYYWLCKKIIIGSVSIEYKTRCCRVVRHIICL
jgi:hypothetical protein